MASGGNGQVSLAWSASSGAASYNVLRSASNGGPYSSIGTGVATTTYLDTSLTNGTTYYYVVQAVNSVGTSSDSNQASATPAVPPQPPASLIATPGNAQVSLGWTASSGATSYNVLRSASNGGPYSSIAMGVATTTYVDTGLTNGTTYYYVVQAVNSGGASGDSNQASARPGAELQSRVNANQAGFFVYEDEDSGFNHGFPSGSFASSTANLATIHLDTGCVDNPADTITGCYPSTNTSVIDTVHGTVMRITFDAQTAGNFAGVNIEEPQNWGSLQTGNGYDLQGASSVTFQVRSPNGGQVQFGVGGCTEPYTGALSLTWTSMTIAFNSLSCAPDLAQLHVLFSVATNDQHDPGGATVLLDNIQFTPLPPRAAQGQEGETLSLPLSNQVFGVVSQTASPFPPDQNNRNYAAIYESALTILTFLEQGDAADAQEVSNALDYALYHDNEGDYLSTAPTTPSGCFSGSAATQCGLHNAYESGDIGLLNAQSGTSGGAKAGDSRLAGFTCGAASPTGYCLVLDGATGGNNAWAILALLAEYKQSGNAKYLNDAITIGNWIIANLTDTSSTGYGGYYDGYLDGGEPPPKTLNQGKSTENNADIFAAFTALAASDSGNAEAWTTAANAAGDFVMQMFDSTNGRFNTGTVLVGTTAGTGTCPTGAQKGNDIINANSSPDCDFLDSDTFATLAMAGAPRYSNYKLPSGTVMDWTRPIQYVLNTFAQSITAGSQTFQGFDIVTTPVSGANGVAWEFTGQTVETLRYVDQIYNQTTFESQAALFLGQIQQAQVLAPFGDGQGLVASTLQGGGTLPPLGQCLNTPFQNCPPERVGLAATSWMILAEEEKNPLAGP